MSGQSYNVKIRFVGTYLVQHASLCISQKCFGFNSQRLRYTLRTLVTNVSSFVGGALIVLSLSICLSSFIVFSLSICLSSFVELLELLSPNFFQFTYIRIAFYKIIAHVQIFFYDEQ